MSKIAAYLRGHISGEVSTRDDIRNALATDAGMLAIKPELVVYPRNTNDVRKIARFSWQLAENGHALPLTIRGAGTDTTGAAVGKGALIVTAAHMNQVFEYDAKQKMIRLQPGVTVSALLSALTLSGASVPSIVGAKPYGTVGGAIATAVAGPLAGKYGSIAQTLDQLEVVLASGDVLQTKRINKRELNRKKGLQGFEGDIYRGIDGIVEEYADVFDKLALNDMAGYNTIADVKRKDGSFDLTPLFVGSQGTLGFVTEMIMKADFRSNKTGSLAIVFGESDAARDALDQLANLRPALLEYYDADLFTAAIKAGRSYKFYTEASEKMVPQSVVVVGFDDFNDHRRQKNVKKAAKLFDKAKNVHITLEDGNQPGELEAILDVTYYTMVPDGTTAASTDLFSGFYIPTARLEDFMKALRALAAHEHVALPLAGHAITNTYAVYPSLSLAKVADKQKFFKLIDALTKLVYAHGGTMVAEGGEGRLKTRAIYAELDTRVVEMYDAIRKVFDPFGTLNPGVKQVSDVRTLASALGDEYGAADFARFGL